MPCPLLKSCAHVFAPAIARLADLSLQTGKFPARYKTAQVLPLLKNAGLDTSLPANYRPISNLSTVSKVLERLVLARLRPHLHGSANFSQYQSAYRKGHSTETALLEVLDGVFTAADKKQVTPCADRPRSVRGLRHSRPPAAPRSSSTRIQSDSYGAQLQGGSADVQGLQHIDTVIPPSPTPGLRGRPQSATTIGHSGAVPTVHQETIAKRAFRCTAPAIWNLLPKTVLDSVSVTSFKSRLKTRAFSHSLLRGHP